MAHLFFKPWWLFLRLYGRFISTSRPLSVIPSGLAPSQSYLSFAPMFHVRKAITQLETSSTLARHSHLVLVDLGGSPFTHGVCGERTHVRWKQLQLA